MGTTFSFHSDTREAHTLLCCKPQAQYYYNHNVYFHRNFGHRHSMPFVCEQCASPLEGMNSAILSLTHKQEFLELLRHSLVQSSPHLPCPHRLQVSIRASEILYKGRFLVLWSQDPIILCPSMLPL